MKALLKIEWIKTWRSWPIFILGIGMPVAFTSSIQVLSQVRLQSYRKSF